MRFKIKMSDRIIQIYILIILQLTISSCQGVKLTDEVKRFAYYVINLMKMNIFNFLLLNIHFI